MKNNIICVSMVLILLQGCASTSNIVFKAEDKAAIEVVEVNTVVVQDELQFDILASNVTGAMGGGLIPALIDASANKQRSKEAFKQLEPLFKVIDNIDYRPIIAGSVNQQIGKRYRLSNPQLSATPIVSTRKQITDKIYSLKRNEAYVHMSAFYNLSSDFKILTLEMMAEIFKNPNPVIEAEADKEATESKYKKSSNRPIPKPVYRNKIIYESKAYGGSEAESIDMWKDNGAELLETEMQAGVAEIASMLKEDMFGKGSEECLREGKVKFHSQIMKAVQGKVLKESEDRIQIRQKVSGNLFSLVNEPVRMKRSRKQKTSASKNCKNKE